MGWVCGAETGNSSTEGNDTAMGCAPPSVPRFTLLARADDPCEHDARLSNHSSVLRVLHQTGARKCNVNLSSQLAWAREDTQSRIAVGYGRKALVEPSALQHRAAVMCQHDASAAEIFQVTPSSWLVSSPTPAQHRLTMLELQGLKFVVVFEHASLSFLESPGPLLQDVIGADSTGTEYLMRQLMSDAPYAVHFARVQRFSAAEFCMRIRRPPQMSHMSCASTGSRLSAAPSQKRTKSALCGCTSVLCCAAAWRRTNMRHVQCDARSLHCGCVG